MPRKLGRTLRVAVAAIAAVGPFIIAGSQAQASHIIGNLSVRISSGNGSYVGHQVMPVNRVPPNVNHPGVHPPGGRPHPGGPR